MRNRRIKFRRIEVGTRILDMYYGTNVNVRLNYGQNCKLSVSVSIEYYYVLLLLYYYAKEFMYTVYRYTYIIQIRKTLPERNHFQ